MKKIIILSTILSVSSCMLLAQEDKNSGTLESPKSGTGALVASGTLAEDQGVKEKVEIRHYKTFGLSVDNQIKVLNKCKQQGGDVEVVRYFLSLKDKNPKKALEILSKDGNEDLRLLLLTHLPLDEFAKLLNELFEGIGGESIVHWGYKKEGEFQSHHMVPCARAQQYVNFFMKHNIKIDTEVQADGNIAHLWGTKKIIKTESGEILHARGKRLAEVFNTMEENKVIELLYGRPDTLFIGDKDRIVPSEDLESRAKFYLAVNDVSYTYQTFEKRYTGYDRAGKDYWISKEKSDYEQHTSPSRVTSNSINYIVPYLSTMLTLKVFEKETNGNIDALVKMVKSLGCDKVLAEEIFDYLPDEIKDKVYASCDEDPSVSNLLGYGAGSNPLALGSGQENKKPQDVASESEL